MLRQIKVPALKRAFCALAAITAAASLAVSGCSRKAASEPGKEPIQAQWTKGQLMAVAATERNRYQNVYTEQIWSAASGQGDMDFEDQLMEQIRSFFAELTLVCAMADEQQLELTGQETDAIGRLSREYFGQLSGGDRDYLEVSQQEIYDLYCAYHRANRLVEEMTGEENLEISDAQAKVIRIQEIVVNDMGKAQEALAAVSREGADFSAAARQYSQGDGQIRAMERSQEPDSLEEAAFSLEQDEISQIVEQEGLYYILKCVDAYDEEATAQRKERMEEEKRNQVFQSRYQPFASECQVVYPEGMWEQITFEGGEDCRTDNFFSMYREYFGRGN